MPPTVVAPCIKKPTAHSNQHQNWLASTHPPVKKRAQGCSWLAVALHSWCSRHASTARFLPCSLSTACTSRSTPSPLISGEMKNCANLQPCVCVQAEEVNMHCACEPCQCEKRIAHQRPVHAAGVLAASSHLATDAPTAPAAASPIDHPNLSSAAAACHCSSWCCLNKLTHTCPVLQAVHPS